MKRIFRHDKPPLPHRISSLRALAVAGILALQFSSRAQPPAGDVDYRKVARDYADCMIRYGRDRYGAVQSPLFSNSLTREKEPRLTPYPLFADAKDPAKNAENRERDQAKQRAAFPGVTFTEFVKSDFNKCVNYPRELNGGEGPHKVTMFGAIHSRCVIFIRCSSSFRASPAIRATRPRPTRR